MHSITYFLTFLFLSVAYIATGQSIDKGYKLKEIGTTHFDSLIRHSLDNEIGSSYFVITYPMAGASTSWGPQFLETYNSVKDEGLDIVVIINNEGGYQYSKIKDFFREIIGLPDSTISLLHFVVDDTLYKEVTKNRYLVRLQYYFRGNLYYDQTKKWHKNSILTLPKEQVSLENPIKYKIEEGESYFLRLKDPLYFLDSSHLLSLSDATNDILRINLKNGNVASVLNISERFSASDLFCKYIVPDDSSLCEFSKSREEYVNSTLRKTVSVDGIYPLSKDSLLITINIEVLEKNRSDFQFANDEGVETTFEEGKEVLNVYTLLAYFDIGTEKLTFLPLKDLPEDTSGSLYTMVENGIKESTSNQYISSYIDYSIPDSSRIGLVSIELDANVAKQAIIAQPKAIYSPKLDLFFTKSFIFDFAHQTYFLFNCEPHIYKPGRNAIQSELIGDGFPRLSAETFPSFLEDTVETNIDFLVHSVSPILDGEYLAVFMNYQGRPVLEVKNRMLKTVDVIELNNIPEFFDYIDCKFREDILIANNTLYLKVIDDKDNLYIYAYKIRRTANTK